MIVNIDNSWFWRCCDGCHGCCGQLYGPWSSFEEATNAHNKWDTSRVRKND